MDWNKYNIIIIDGMVVPREEVWTEINILLLLLLMGW